MALCLSKLTTPMPGCLLRKGPRVFALLGKATPLGLAAFSREDVSRSWALTAEFGCLRLERLSGDEEVTGEQVFLPLPADYDYGLTGPDKSPELTRAVFGLLRFRVGATGQRPAARQFPGAGFLPAGPALQPDLLHHPGLLAARGDLQHGAARERRFAGGVRAGDGGLAAASPAERAVPGPAAGVQADDAAGGQAAPRHSLQPGNAGDGAGTGGI